ncbi:MAG: 4Fe-4S binding protein [Chloroflexi bacterium]|nr:4Fe-4S binding protein [Chloroflexota bacterium]
MPSILEIDTKKCTGCGDCVVKCPVHAVEMVDGKAVVVHPEVCTYCTDCEALCGSGAISCPFEIILVEPPKVSSVRKQPRRKQQTERRKKE